MHSLFRIGASDANQEYAPKEGKDDSVKDELYSCLESVFDFLFSNDVKIVLGEFNVNSEKSWHTVDLLGMDEIQQ